VPDAARRVQEGVGEQAPDLAVQDGVEVEAQGAGERLTVEGLEGAGDELEDEAEDVEGNEPFGHLALLGECAEEAGPLAAVVFAVVDAHVSARLSLEVGGRPRAGRVSLLRFTTRRADAQSPLSRFRAARYKRSEKVEPPSRAPSGAE